MVCAAKTATARMGVIENLELSCFFFFYFDFLIDFYSFFFFFSSDYLIIEPLKMLEPS